MKRIALGLTAFLLAPVAGLPAADTPKPAGRPNIILILADDLGHMDIGANNPGTFYETPNIDSLARRGMRFTQGYAACCVCSPTRGSIMTGKYPPRFGITDFIPGMRPGKLQSAPNADHLPLAELTVAEAFRDGGYATFFAGKWHLGGGEFYPAPGLSRGPGDGWRWKEGHHPVLVSAIRHAAAGSTGRSEDHRAHRERGREVHWCAQGPAVLRLPAIPGRAHADRRACGSRREI